MINTLNESQLHKALKTFYAVQFNAQEEVKVERWICDLVCPDGTAIEIQTKNVGALRQKVQGLLESGRRVAIVHPIIKEKIIETRGLDGGLVSRRKSPKKESLWSELSEFTGMAELLTNKKLVVLLPKITVLESRVKTKEAEQSKNGRRRFKKDWQKTGKALLTIEETVKLSGKKDWLGLLPKEILQAKKSGGKTAEAFCSATIRELFAQKKETKAAAPHASLLLWLLRKAGLIVRVPHPGRGYWHVLK